MTTAAAQTWYHTIDLPDGGCTKGWFDTRDVPSQLTWPAGLAGGRCLDVGTFDGFWAFELERRGAAEVVAVDLDDPTALDWFFDERQRGPEMVAEWGTERGVGFAKAAQLVGSRARRVNQTVYDLDPERLGTFDVVFCGALLLHLANPVRALEAMRSVCSGELVLVEHLDSYLELAAPRLASAAFSPDWDQWWRPNSAGLISLVEHAGWEVVWVGDRFVVPFGPAAPRPPWRRWALDAIAARKPLQRGLLFRGLRAVPRDPRPHR